MQAPVLFGNEIEGGIGTRKAPKNRRTPKYKARRKIDRDDGDIVVRQFHGLAKDGFAAAGEIAATMRMDLVGIEMFMRAAKAARVKPAGGWIYLFRDASGLPYCGYLHLDHEKFATSGQPGFPT